MQKSNLKMTEINESDVTIIDAISQETLQALINGQTQVLVIKNFISDNACKYISEGLMNYGYDDYIDAPSVGRIGMSYFETGLKDELIAHYFKHAKKNIHILREACYPYACPIDTFRCVMDEEWLSGCTLQNLYNNKMFVGLSRCIKPEDPLLAHHDMFTRHAPNTPETNNLISQFGVNVYVDVPEEGGELAMWHKEISDAEFSEQRGSQYGISLEPLGEPDFTVKPKDGDLILFNARKLHAVLPGKESNRLTLSAFFGYRGIDKPLTVWS